MKLSDLNNVEMAKSALEAYDFKLVTWQEFLDAKDKPDGLLERALDTVKRCNIDVTLSHVTYDPLDGEEGFMLIGDATAIAKETCEQIMEMDISSGPLFDME